MRIFSLLLITLLLSACSSYYENNNVYGKTVPLMQGQTLEKQDVQIPDVFTAPLNLLLIGYKQDAQFDIDRWLIGLEMTKTTVDTYEIPAIQGMFPRMLKTQINNGMRSGIPKELWQGVITLYKDGETMQAFTGNKSPNNARVMLLNQQGKIVYFYDRGFSVNALSELKNSISKHQG